jgi:tetratricopeptide (TPR) repeat protein
VGSRRSTRDPPPGPPVDTLVDAPRSTLLTRDAVTPADDAEITDRVPRARGLVDGAIVDRYVVVSHLGSGGMGAVYAAWDQQLGRRVALKLLHPGPLATEQQARRLRREARALARLDHEHVVRVFDVGEWEGSPWITMEYVDGLDIDAFVKAKQPSREAIVRLFMEAAEGLAAAHALGIIHRDVKGQNILVGADGRVRVGDFGIATFQGEGGEEPPQRPVAHDEISLRNRVTLDGTVLGTPGYMAPEQLEGTDVDARCDQFAFCVALWRAVFGEDPFPAPDAILARFERMRAPPQTPRRRWPALEQVLTRGLRFDVAARHPDMLALHAALDAVLQRPRRRAIGAAAVVVVSLLSGGAIAVVRHDPCGLRAAGAAVLAPLASSSSSSPLVAGALAPWVERWTASAIAVCRQDELDDDVRAARLRCFEARRQDAAALVGLVIDGRVSDDAGLQAALALPPPVSCLDDRGATPADPEGTALLSSARMALLAGEPAVAEAAATQAMTRARSLGHDAFVADAARLVGQAAMHRGALVEAEAAFRDGIGAAMASGAARTEAMLWTGLIELLVDKFKRRDEARTLAPWMQAAARRFPDDLDLQGERLVVEALLANESGDHRGGAGRATEAFTLALRRDPVSPHAIARATDLRALLLAASGEQQAAIAALREGVDIMRRSLPEHHIRFMALHNTLGLALRRAGDLAGARRAFVDSVTVAERQRRPADHAALHGVPLANIGAIDLVDGDLQNARERATRAHALLVGSIGPASDRVSYVDELLAFVAAAEGRFDDARRHAADIVARHAARDPGGLLHSRSIVLVEAIEVEAATPTTRRARLATARARLAAVVAVNDGGRASLALGRAAFALVAGDDAEARVFLDAAAASHVDQHGSAEERELYAGLRALLDDHSPALVPDYVPLGRLVREAVAKPRAGASGPSPRRP